MLGRNDFFFAGMTTIPFFQGTGYSCRMFSKFSIKGKPIIPKVCGAIWGGASQSLWALPSLIVSLW